jgi:hypothetical protein
LRDCVGDLFSDQGTKPYLDKVLTKKEILQA